MKKSFIVRLLLLPLLLLCVLNTTYASAHQNIHRHNTQANQILLATPKTVQENHKPKASVGVVLYTHNAAREIFLLIGQEVDGKKDAGTYCELGGSAELDQSGKPESFVTGAIRECHEESARIYQLDPDYVLSNGYTYYNITPTGREEVYIFLKAPKYVPVSDLIHATAKQKEDKYKEKANFKWAKLSDLLACSEGKCNVYDIEGKQEEIVLRSFFHKTLHSPKILEIIQSISAHE